VSVGGLASTREGAPHSRNAETWADNPREQACTYSPSCAGGYRPRSRLHTTSSRPWKVRVPGTRYPRCHYRCCLRNHHLLHLHPRPRHP
jgi:hypothetical protein